jgi:hypothetical protein
VPEVTSQTPVDLSAGDYMTSLGSGISGAPEAGSNILETLATVRNNNLFGPLGGWNPMLGGGGQYTTFFDDNGLGGLGMLGIGNYGSGVDSVRVGKARFQPRQWLMDYGNGSTINSFGRVGTAANPNRTLSPTPPANPGDGGLMDSPGAFPRPPPNDPNGYGGFGGFNFPGGYPSLTF